MLKVCVTSFRYIELFTKEQYVKGMLTSFRYIEFITKEQYVKGMRYPSQIDRVHHQGRVC